MLVYARIYSKLVMMATVFFMLTSIEYLLLIHPLFVKMNELKYERQRLQRTLTVSQHKKDAMEHLRQELDILIKQHEIFIRALGHQDNGSHLLETISGMASHLALSLDSLSPMREKKHQFYMELPVKISLLGEYHQLLMFLNQLNANAFVFNWSYLDVTSLLEQTHDALKLKMIISLHHKIKEGC